MEKNLSNLKHCIHVAFHLTNEVASSTNAARIGVLLGKIFGQDQIEIVDLDTQDNEIVYRIRKPILYDVEVQKDFFRGLQELFEETDEYHPHFTQIYS